MSYILKKQKFYVEVDANSRPALTGNIALATKYKTLLQAANFLNNNIKPEEHSRYQIIDLTKERPSLKKTPPEKSKDIISGLRTVETQILTSMEKEKTKLQQTIEYYENIICDILHFIREDSIRLNACQAAKVFYKQQEITRKRASAKKELKRILEVEKFMSSIIEAAESFDFSEYNPREISDMSTFLGL